MEVFTDKVFVQAVSTIKSLTDLSKSTNLPRPSLNDRLKLYGLYNQSTRGDVTSIINLQADVHVLNSSTEMKKYESWLKFKGLTKNQARKQYIKYLLELLNNSYNYSNNEYPLVISLKQNLQDSWDTLEEFNQAQNQQHLKTIVNTQIPITTSVNNTNINNIPRSHSPAASLYRIASSGLNSNIIRPPSRNQSISKSRQNSFSGITNTNSNNISNQISNSNSNVISMNNFKNNINNNEINNSSLNSTDFIKWQGEINNTLLKISTELSNIKLQNSFNNLNNRSISGSTTMSFQSEIQDYKIRYNSNNDHDNDINNSRIPSFNNYNINKIKNIKYNDNNSKDDKKTFNSIIEWIYLKMIMLINYLKGKIFIKMKFGYIQNSIFRSMLAFIILNIIKKLVNLYLIKNLRIPPNGNLLFNKLKCWLIETINVKNMKRIVR